MGEMIYQNGFRPVVQTDFSQVVVDQMKKNYESKFSDMFWDCADAREPLTHLLKHLQDDDDKDIYFGSVIDKGLIDALYLADGEALNDIPKVVSNVIDVLDPDYGVFLTLSRSHPDYLEQYLKNSSILSIEARRLEYPDIYLYRLCKGPHSMV